MPTIKRSLTRPEKLDHLARAKQMRAEGVDLRIREEWLEGAHSLDITIVGFHSMVYDLRGGGAAYAVWVRLVARRRITLTDCKLVTDWDTDIGLVGFFDGREPVWWLGHQDFPRSQVLNQRIMDSLKFHGYDYMVEGVILFTGSQPMPEAYPHGMNIPFTLVFLDQNENEIREDAELFVDRTWKQKNKFVPRGRSLYDPDEASAPIESAFRPNLNRGRVPDLGAEMLKNRPVRKEPESEAMASLRKAIRELSPR